MGRLELDFAQLSAGELDDQALAEISALLSSSAGPEPPTASWLIGLAATGDLIVARRPCGAQPEIVGVAAGTRAKGVLVAVDASSATAGLAAELRRRIEAPPSAASLFRRRDRAPLGLF